jgi:hypothetical protein
MISKATPSFWRCFHALPIRVQRLAYKNYRLWLENPYHPSLRFKPLKGDLWSVRVGGHYRAVGYFRDDDAFVWIWVGSHEEYSKL